MTKFRSLFFLLFSVLFICGNKVNGEGTPKNCKDVLKNGGTSSGIYQIETKNGPRQILCDQETNGGGWTVIQQRFNANERFWNRNWSEYANGFGTIGKSQNFYLGNDLISEFTHQSSQNSTLRIELWGDRNPGSAHSNDFHWGEYYFRMDDAKTDYTAQIFIIDWLHERGNLSNGWYDISYSNGVKFSTIDHINDPDPDCQPKYHMGGWWTHYCGLASLNGEYVPSKFGDGYGLFFTIDGQYVINPKKTKMMVRNRD